MEFNTDIEVVTNELPKEEAIAAIVEMAQDKGISGTFKVFLDDELVSSTENLPDMVDMDLIRVSANYHQA